MTETPRTTTTAAGTVASDLPGGVVHELPADLASALLAEPETAQLWRGLTPLGRNEFVCWVEDAKKPETRAASGSFCPLPWRSSSQSRFEWSGHC